MGIPSFSCVCALVALLLASISPIDARQPRRHQPQFSLSKCTIPLSNGMSYMYGFSMSSTLRKLPFSFYPVLYPDVIQCLDILFLFSPLATRNSHELGTASLPAPDGLKVKAITLGRGTQNYTCEPGSTAPPKAIGAIATLYDASPFLPFLPPSEGDEILALLPDYLISLNFDALQTSFLPVLGHHFFDVNGTPVFDLGKVGLFRGKKNAAIAAPSDSFKGPFNQGSGAVDWLHLCAVEGSECLKEAYRVETAGGKPPASCAGQPATIEVEYATEYWFYSTG